MTTPPSNENQMNLAAGLDMRHESDAVIAPGLSVHFYGKTVGLYSSRLKVGKGFTELPVSDLIAIVDFFKSAPAAAKLSEWNKANLPEA